MGSHEIPTRRLVRPEPTRLRAASGRLIVALATATFVIASFAFGPPFLRVVAIFLAAGVAVGLVADAGTRDFGPRAS